MISFSANERLHECYKEHVMPCIPLLLRFNQELKDKVRVKVKKANDTCYDNKEPDVKPLNVSELGRESLFMIDKASRIMVVINQILKHA